MADARHGSDLLIEQRDRFVAFAFCAAEVLIELDPDGRVAFAAGGVHALLGLDPDAMTGQPFRDFAADHDRVLVDEMIRRLDSAFRVTDIEIALAGTDGRARQQLVCAIRSTQRPGIKHLALRRLPVAARQRDSERIRSPVTREAFVAAATEAGGLSALEGEAPKLGLYEIDLAEVRLNNGRQAAADMASDMVQSLRAWASPSSPVGEIAAGKYGVLLDQGADTEALGGRLREIADSHGVDQQIDQAVLKIEDVLEDSELPDMLDRALRKFDSDGAAAIDTDSLRDLARPEPRPGETRSAFRARRKGVQEGWE